MTRVLFVCTANQCRSPIAAALLRRRLPLELRADVCSAGLLPGGFEVAPPALRRMRKYGVDLTAHRSVQVDAAQLSRAELIIGMTREHVRALVAEDPGLRTRCYTLKDFVRRAEQCVDQDIPGPLCLLLDVIDAQRPVEALLGRSRDDDVEDPMRRSPWVWAAVVTQLADLVDRLASLLLVWNPSSAVTATAPPIPLRPPARGTSFPTQPKIGPADPAPTAR
jgi:protein-tyrosine phosphatase